MDREKKLGFDQFLGPVDRYVAQRIGQRLLKLNPSITDDSCSWQYIA